MSIVKTKHGIRFHVTVVTIGPSRLQGKVSKGLFVPLKGRRDFDARGLKVPQPLEGLLCSGNYSFVRVEDWNNSSILSELEGLAYHMDGVTFVLHNAERPYFWFLVGEDISTTEFRRAKKVLHALQRLYVGKEKAGKPSDIRQMFKVAAASRKGGPVKLQALSVAKTEHAGTSLTAFSAMKKKLGLEP